MLKVSFDQWLGAVRTHGKLAIPLLSPDVFANWLPPGKRQAELKRLASAQKHVTPFVDHVISGEYDEVRLKLQSMSFLVRRADKRVLGFLNAVINLSKNGRLNLTVSTVDAHGSP